MMKRTALSIVKDALARRGGFGMDASDEKKKPWTVEQTSDDEVTYKFKVHINKKKFKPVSKELAQQVGVAGNGAGDGEKGEDEDGKGGRGGSAQDSAFYVVMDSPSAAVNAARRQCAATIEQCRARNKFACPYHGAQAVKADLIDRLTAAGINSVPTVEPFLDRRGKPTGTYSISIPCVNTPDQRRAMERVIDQFLRSPGIDQESTGEGARNDYEEDDQAYNSLFDVDALNTEARNDSEAHEEREEEPPTAQEHSQEAEGEQPAAEPETAQDPEQTEQPEQEESPETPAEAESETPPAEEPRQEEQTDLTQAEEGWGTFEDADGNPIRMRTDIQEYMPREILIDYMNGLNSNEARDLLGVNLDFDNASVRDMRELISAANHLDQLGANYANTNNASDRENIQREIETSKDSLLRAIAKYATPLQQSQPQSAAPAEATEPAEGQRVTAEELERASSEQEQQQREAQEEIDRVFSEENGSQTANATQTEPQTQQTAETPQPEPAANQQSETQTPTQASTEPQPIPTTPFSDMAAEEFRRAKNAAFAAGADDRVAQARGRALSSVLGNANGIAGGHNMSEIHDRLHRMMAEAVMRNDRESVQGYQQALDMIGHEGGFTPRPFDPSRVRAPEIDYNAIEHGEGDDITDSEIEAVKNLAKAANIDAYNAGSNDSSRSPEAAYAHALANFLSRDGGLQRREGITRSLLKDKMRARIRAKEGDEVATEGTLGAIAAVGNILNRNMAGFEFLREVQNGIGGGQQTRQAAPPATQQQTATTSATPQEQTHAPTAEPPRQTETTAPQMTTQPHPAAQATPSPQPARATPQPQTPLPQRPAPQQQPQVPATPRQTNNGFTGRRAQAAARRLDEAVGRAGTGRVRSILGRLRDNARRLGGQNQN